jgi:hypothetical protein
LLLQGHAHLRDERVGVERFDDVIHRSEGVPLMICSSSL